MLAYRNHAGIHPELLDAIQTYNGFYIRGTGSYYESRDAGDILDSSWRLLPGPLPGAVTDGAGGAAGTIIDFVGSSRWRRPSPRKPDQIAEDLIFAYDGTTYCTIEKGNLVLKGDRTSTTLQVRAVDRYDNEFLAIFDSSNPEAQETIIRNRSLADWAEHTDIQDHHIEAFARLLINFDREPASVQLLQKSTRYNIGSLREVLLDAFLRNKAMCQPGYWTKSGFSPESNEIYYTSAYLQDTNIPQSCANWHYQVKRGGEEFAFQLSRTGEYTDKAILFT